MIAPDDKTFAYLAGREFAPSGANWDKALAFWRTLPATTARCSIASRPRCARARTDGDLGTSPEEAVAVTAPCRIRRCR